MILEKIKKDVFYAGVNDRERKVFDAIFPLDYGTSYNSYLIKGSEKTVLIDTVDSSKKEEFLEQLSKTKKIDYIVSNHAEQDHSGSIRAVLKKYPDAKILTTAYCKSILIDLHHINENKFEIVTENQEFPLGGKTLKFIFTPWAHWPETFSTYLIEDKILFSCDFFGAHLSIDGLFDENIEKQLKYSKEYFALIMMPFREILKRNLEKVEELELDIIAPSHGPLYKNPKIILEAYKDWIYSEPKNKVLIPYVSMHGSTKLLVLDLATKLKEKNIETIVVNLEEENIGKLAEHLVDSKFLIFGAPTLLSEAHPVVIMTANVIRLLKTKIKYAGVIGSYGWGGRTVEVIEEALKNMSLEFLEPVMVKGLPQESDYELISSLVKNIEEKLNH